MDFYTSDCSQDERIEYDSLHRMTLECEKKYRKSWINLGKCLFLLDSGGYEEFKSLRNYSTKFLKISYSKCKEIYLSYKYLTEHFKEADLEVSRIPPYSTLNLCRRASKRYPDNEKIKRLEARLFKGELSHHKYKEKLKMILSEVIENSDTSEPVKKNPAAANNTFNDAIQVLHKGLIDRFGHDKAERYLKSLEQIKTALLLNE